MTQRRSEPPPRLRVDQLTKRYAATVLDQVSIDFRGGEIHALLGANGAGKSTLCKIIAGLATPTDGTMSIDGEPYAPADKAAAETQGVQIVQQELNLIPTLSVAENLYLRDLPRRLLWIDRRKLHARAITALARMDLNEIAPETLAGELGIGTRHRESTIGRNRGGAGPRQPRADSGRADRGVGPRRSQPPVSTPPPPSPIRDRDPVHQPSLG